jgi:hypothetical protein
MSHSKSPKAYWNMTTAELRAATQEFNSGDGGPAQVAPREERQRQIRARRKRPSQPRAGVESRRVSLRIEGKRLKLIDREAKRLGLSRSEFIARALTRELATA